MTAPREAADRRRGDTWLPGSRRQARELAMKAMFARDIGQGRPQDALTYLCNEEGAAQEVAAYAAELIESIAGHLAEIDRRIADYARGFTLARLAAVDRNVLRLGLCELLFRDDVPPGVAISEAVELAKVYGGEESGGFVNGMLGQVARDRAAGAARP